jgi:predicted aldo/keto reductase-like oxidoreductase
MRSVTGRPFAPRRMLGRTGFAATVLGIGDVADRTLPIEECVATVRRAMAAGLNVIDTAPGYEDGYSEEIVGRAVQDARERMFVIDKIDHLERPVGPQVEGSLGRLGLPNVDCFLFHGVSRMADWERLASPGGGFAQLDDCRRQGQCRFRGISSHHPDVLRAAIESDLCDVVMFAIGPFCDRRYVEEVLPLARSRHVGTVCFKTFGAGKLVADTTGYGRPLVERPRGKMSSGPGGAAADWAWPKMDPGDCVRYTLTIDPDVALLGMSFPVEQDAAFAAAQAFRPLPPADMDRIRVRAVECMTGKGDAWWDPKP